MFGGEVLHQEDFGKDGFFIIALDPSQLSPDFETRVSSVLNHIRNSPPAPGYDSVPVPGDRSAKTLKDTIARGTVDVADKTLEKLQELAS